MNSKSLYNKPIVVDAQRRNRYKINQKGLEMKPNLTYESQS